ncbi:hypothetical protein [Pseudomonas sp. LB3P31]
MTIRIRLERIQELAESRKMSAEEVLRTVNIESAEYVEIDTTEKLKELSSVLIIPMCDLLQGVDSDLENGVKISRVNEGFCKTSSRGGKKYYTYQHLATSNTAPELMALKVSLHCNGAEDIVLNAGHVSKEVVLVLKGVVRVDWGGSHSVSCFSEVLVAGDSVYVSPNVPHSFIALEDGSEILAFNYKLP